MLVSAGYERPCGDLGPLPLRYHVGMGRYPRHRLYPLVDLPRLVWKARHDVGVHQAPRLGRPPHCLEYFVLSTSFTLPRSGFRSQALIIPL